MDLKDLVKEKYGEAALLINTGASSCDSTIATQVCCAPITSNLYDATEISQLPDRALFSSFGCGNPSAIAELRAGETVLDLGSGGGIDVLLSARRVGWTGKAYGLDMTDEMLKLALENQRKAATKNVEFLKGDIENIPLPDNSVDVVISNCVINLSADKDRVFREAFRVLKPCGRFVVSDVISRGEVPDEVKTNVRLWIGCVAGALNVYQYIIKLAEAQFDNVDIRPSRRFDIEDARTFLSGRSVDVNSVAPLVQGKFMNAYIRATKPTHYKTAAKYVK